MLRSDSLPPPPPSLVRTSTLTTPHAVPVAPPTAAGAAPAPSALATTSGGLTTAAAVALLTQQRNTAPGNFVKPAPAMMAKPLAASSRELGVGGSGHGAVPGGPLPSTPPVAAAAPAAAAAAAAPKSAVRHGKPGHKSNVSFGHIADILPEGSSAEGHAAGESIQGLTKPLDSAGIRLHLDGMVRAAPADMDFSVGPSIPGSYAHPPAVLSWKNVTLKTKNGNYPILKVCGVCVGGGLSQQWPLIDDGCVNPAPSHPPPVEGRPTHLLPD